MRTADLADAVAARAPREPRDARWTLDAARSTPGPRLEKAVRP
jgi:hypothetical protein